MNSVDVKNGKSKLVDLALIKLVYWLLPKAVIKWAVVRAILHATNGKFDKTAVDQITAVEVLKRLEESNKRLFPK